ncbi:MAG: hypothetical protein U9P07_10595 [Pseudomonadota bacterium]|nr:hypothetical protein [Pseudomonadota bacterium]
MFRHGSRSFSPAVHGLPVRAARRQAGLWGALKQCPRVRRESRRVIRSAANTAMSQARTSCVDYFYFTILQVSGALHPVLRL